MTVASVLNRITYTGNGSTTAFAVSFPFHSQSDLIVVETVIATGVQTSKTITTHYTVSGSTDSLGYYSNGGTVNAVTAPPATVTWTIYRNPSLLQSLNLSENNALPPESLEAQLDYMTMLVQRLNDVVGRSLRQPDGDSADIDLLPSKVARASTYLAFDTDGDPVATAGTTTSYVVTPFIETLLDDANAAAARATLGARHDSMATGKLLGRTTASTGAIEEITPGADLSLSGLALGVVAASESAAGKIEIATEAEIETGTSNVLAVTPGRLKGAIGFTAYYESSAQTITAGGALTLAHGMSRTPILVTVELKCTDAGGEGGYVQNDLVHVGISTNDGDGSAGYKGCSVIVNSTNLVVRFGSAASSFRVPNASSGVAVDITNSKWNAIFRAWG